MNFRDKIRPGMQLLDAQGNELGTVDRFEGDTYYVGNRRVPFSAFERMDGDRLYVGQSGLQHFSGAGMQAGASAGMTGGTHDEGAARVPLMEERLNVETRPVEMGEVEVRKDVVSERVDVPVELTRDDVRVRQEKVERPVAEGEAAFQEGTIRVPVRGEEAVVEKQAVVTGEVLIDRERTTQRENVSDTVRREVVGVDHDEGIPVSHGSGGVSHWNDVRDTWRQGWEQRYGSSGRRWQDAEPGYHYAHEMSNDARFRGRAWSEVEPELRSGYGDWSRQRGYADVPGEDAWQRLHQDVREGWEDTHARTR